ncbi:hypothetical protein [Paenibacillus sp. FSL H8-0034]|uniref:hypothetical protein n=1 Tax=Paenibacillus sp. FSL H8-0034 TaxID=2954671 RepID=UPI0030FC2C8F
MNEKNGPACGLTKNDLIKAVAAGETLSSIERAWGMKYNTVHVWVKKWELTGINAEKARMLLEQLDSAITTEVPNVPETSKEAEETLEKLKTELHKSEQEADDFASGILERDRTISELKDQLKHSEDRYQFDKERTLKLEGDVERLVRGLEAEERETKHLNELLKGAAIVADQAGARINELEEEQCALLAIIDAASENVTDSVVTIRVPITAAMQPIQQRIDVYNGIDLFESAIEAAELDRTRVMSELFALVQRVADYVTSDLVELIPGEDVSKYVQRFMAYHNDQHIERMKIKQQAG